MLNILLKSDHEKLYKRNILRHRISWNNKFDFRHNHGSSLVVFCLTMVVCSLWISCGIFLDGSSLALYTHWLLTIYSQRSKGEMMIITSRNLKNQGRGLNMKNLMKGGGRKCPTPVFTQSDVVWFFLGGNYYGRFKNN